MTASSAPLPAPAPAAFDDWLPGLAGIDTGDTLIVADGARPMWRHVAITRASRSRAMLLPNRLELRIAPQDHDFALALIAAFASPGEMPAAADMASRTLMAMAGRVAAHDVTVLIEGETGTGKEGLARLVHTLSPRRDTPLVAVNCAALPDTMLEATLFGHERGAFTGADRAADGLIRAADHGTLLLDEIAELPLALQAKLLRTLQEREVLPIGASRALPIDVRFIACANRDLAAEVAAGRFRADLYYRLAVFPLRTLPLRQRPADIAAIAAHWLLRRAGSAAGGVNSSAAGAMTSRAAGEMTSRAAGGMTSCAAGAMTSRAAGAGAGIIPWVSAAALVRLKGHDWPGNVRELGNVLDRAMVYLDGETIETRHLAFDRVVVDGMASAASGPAMVPAPLPGLVRTHEDRVIRSVLSECPSRRAAAERLGISERTLRYKLAAMKGAAGMVQ